MGLGALVNVLKKVVPVVASLVGGDVAGKAAAAILGVAEDVTGKKGDEAVKAIEADPALALQFEQALMAQEKDLIKLQLDDVKDARTRDIEVRKLTGGKNTRADILAYSAVASFIALIFVFFWKTPDASTKDIFVLLIGNLSGVVTTIYAYEFGSSRGSKEKTSILGLDK
jgi:hypothetical protein